MAVFNEPAQWDHTLGNNADTSTLPDDAAATAGIASLQKLFQIINATPLEAGGIAPDREDVNALFKYLGDQIFYTQNGGVPSYNASYDYIPGRVVLYTDNKLYKCIQANGASSTVVAPDSVSPLGSDYWLQVATLADLANFADISLSNINNTAKIAIAHNAMPSSVYDDLTLGASGTDYTAPADGYVLFARTATAVGNWISILSTLRIASSSSTSNTYGLRVFLPVRKGDTFKVGYYGGNDNVLRFIYAVGSESEKA